MVRVMTTEGAAALSTLEDGLLKAPEDMTDEEFWWDFVEKNSEKSTLGESKFSPLWIRLGKSFLLSIFQRGNFHLLPEMLSK